MNNKNIILIIIILAIAAGAYFLFTKDGNTPTLNTEDKIVYCDENGNRYNTVAEAKAAGLTDAQYGATFCPEYIAAKSGNYTGLTVDQAEEVAEARGEMFRVVEIDGEVQPTTKDFQEGRINATVMEGVVTEYTVESMNPSVQENESTDPAAHNVIIGMTVDDAEAYAETNDADFRVGTVDGEGMPVTLDFRPGRITAEVENGIVTGYTIE